MGKGVSSDSMKVAKTAAATSFEDENVVVAGDNTRRRLAAANSRGKANAFWTSMMASNVQQNGQGGGKSTLG